MELKVENLRKGDILKLSYTNKSIYIGSLDEKLIIWINGATGFIVASDLQDVASWTRGDIDMMKAVKCTGCEGMPEFIGDVTMGETASTICTVCNGEGLIEAPEPEPEPVKELEPYDWNGENAVYSIDSCGTISLIFDTQGDQLFYFSKVEQAEDCALNLKIRSDMLGLKKTLNDRGSTHGVKFALNRITGDMMWMSKHLSDRSDWGIIKFSNYTVDKVVDYLNKHYPNGFKKEQVKQ